MTRLTLMAIVIGVIGGLGGAIGPGGFGELVGLTVSTAHAGTCNGDDDDDSGSWDVDSDHDSESADATPACINTTDIVGRSECTSFGSWDASDRPRMRFGMGSSVSVFDASDLTFRGTANHEDHKTAFRVDQRESVNRTEAVAGALDAWITSPISRHLYLGGTFSMGAVSLPDTEVTTVNGLSVDTNGAMYLAFGAIAGAQVSLGPVTLRSEAVVGYRAVVLAVETRQGDCIENGSVHAGQLMVRPQVALETWLTPRATFGVTASTDAFREGDVSGGVFLQLHTQAFDGTRSR